MPQLNLGGTGQAVDTSYNTINSAFFTLMNEKPVVKTLATRLTLKAGEGSSKNIVDWNRFTAARIDDGIEMTLGQALSDAQVSYTPTELGVMCELADTLVDRVADRQLVGRVGTMMGDAYNLLEDTEGCDQMANWSTSIGAATRVMQIGHLTAIAAGLAVGNNLANPEPAPDPKFLLLHPSALTVVVNRMMPLTDVPTGTNVYIGTSDARGTTFAAGTNTMTEQLLKKGPKALGTVSGIPIYTDANLGVDSDNDSDQGGFSKAGLIYVNEKDPSMKSEYNIKRRSWTYVMVGRNIWGTHRTAAYGIRLITDAVIPTS